jgi:hypothetical protein
LKLPEVNFLKWLRIGFHISPTMLDRRLRPPLLITSLFLQRRGVANLALTT